MSTISTTITHTVTVGSGAYGSPLTITGTGAVYPAAYGALGVFENGASFSLTNDGHIAGGVGYLGANSTTSYGGDGGNGGTAAELSAGTLVNYGYITGGTGGTGGSCGKYYVGGYGGAGGTGVIQSGGMLTNQGDIAGGAGGKGGGTNYFSETTAGGGGTGGTGVMLSGGTLTNQGIITGGDGGSGGNGEYGFNGGVGGVGVYLSAGTLINSDDITGGTGGYGGSGAGGAGGVGVYLSAGTLINSADITGGTGGTGGSDLYDPGVFGGAGGVGVYVVAGTLMNSGDITGGTGGSGGSFFDGVGNYSATAGAGGTGVLVGGHGTTLTNTGSITGGAGGVGGNYYGRGGAGGAGVVMLDAHLTNNGSIAGGDGGEGGRFGPAKGGAGGTGVDLTGGNLTNDSTIIGGYGGHGSQGGTGVQVYGATLTNSGSIAAGNGGIGTRQYGYPYRGFGGGAGGAGVFLDGGTLTTSGTISGGLGGTDAYYGNGAAGDAVQFGALAGKLMVDPGAVFNGNVVANGAVIDTLEVAGTQAGGTPITLGTQFTNFSTLQFAAGAAWTVDVGTGAVSNTHGLMTVQGFASGATLDVTNLTPTQVAADFNPNTERLTMPADGTLHFSGSFSGEYFVFTSDGGAGTDVTLAAGSGISTTITKTVAVGSAAHPSPLTITNTGVVAPTAVGATGVSSNVAGNSLTNEGSIVGGSGSGVGLSDLKGTVANFGSIRGGAGGNGASFGGIGVQLGGGTLTNHGSITGGNGGANEGGGAGVNANRGTLTNYGNISGGSGAGGGSSAGLNGGAGVYLLAGNAVNNGNIAGGAGGAGTVGGRGGFGALLKGGTLTNNGSISGGIGGTGSTTGGNGGPGVFLNGGKLITAGVISGGVAGAGSGNGSSGDAVQFGTAASTLIVDPGAVFNGLVVANATAADVLELAGVQSGGTALTLGTQFTNFSALDFAAGASGTVAATKTDLTAHPLSIAGFALGDTLDITNLAFAGTTLSFNTTTEILTIDHGTTAISVQFNKTFAGDHFVASAIGNGAGTAVSLATGAAATLAALGRDALNFVSEHHRALVDERFMAGFHSVGSSVAPAASAAAQDFSAFGSSSIDLIDHGLGHAAIGVAKA